MMQISVMFFHFKNRYCIIFCFVVILVLVFSFLFSLCLLLSTNIPRPIPSIYENLLGNKPDSDYKVCLYLLSKETFSPRLRVHVGRFINTATLCRHWPCKAACQQQLLRSSGSVYTGCTLPQCCCATQDSFDVSLK